MTDNTHDSDPLGGNVLSIALICPSEQRRRTIASALNSSHAAIVREYSSYPPTLKEMPRMLGEKVVRRCHHRPRIRRRICSGTR